MRIHTDNAQHYLQALAVSIERDPVSLGAWHCLHIGRTEQASREWYDDVLRGIKEAHKDLDCDVVHCSDNDVLFISRDSKSCELYEVADELMNATIETNGKQGEVALYDLFHDWRSIRELLLSKIPLDKLPTLTPPTHDFGEIGALRDVFAEAKKMRSAREPQHILLVEDDPLTRRLITGSFKDKYALVSAVDAQEAVMNYLLYAPDIVFLDINLPDTNGFDVLHQILDSDPDAYVVMFSGNSYLDNVTKALSAGAAGFIAKPFKKDLMQHYIEASAAHHRKLV